MTRSSRSLDFRQFERRLYETWLELFESNKQECDGTDKPKTGREIYDKTLVSQQIYLRPGCSEQFVMRGTYHILADAIKIGWHPRLEILMKQEKTDDK